MTVSEQTCTHTADIAATTARARTAPRLLERAGTRRLDAVRHPVPLASRKPRGGGNAPEFCGSCPVHVHRTGNLRIQRALCRREQPAAGSGARPSTPRSILAPGPALAPRSGSTPEVDQGFGLDGTLGVAGFPSGEAYKVGKDQLPICGCSGSFCARPSTWAAKARRSDPDQNQLGGSQTANRLVLTVGRFSVYRCLRHQQVRPRPTQRFPELGADRHRHLRLRRRRLGLHLRRRRRVVSGSLDAARRRLRPVHRAQQRRLDPTFGQDQYVGEIEERHHDRRPGRPADA